MHTQELDLMLQGDLVLPDEVVPDGRVGVKNGLIVGLYDREEQPPAKQFIDARGLLVFPGIVDAHVHSYSNPAEGFEHSTPAAAAGGVTTIVEMPYDAHGPTSSPDAFRAKVDLVRHQARVDVALLATLRKDGSPEVIAPLVELGASGFKLSLNEADPVRFPRIVEDVLLQVLPLIAAHGLTVGFHAENDDITRQLVAKFRREGKNYPRAHCESRPPIAETLAVVGLLELAHWTRCQLHIFHSSLPRTIQLIWRFREDGVNVSTETCPHYLLLNETDMDRLKTFAKINPPMRTPEMVEEMWALVKSGAIDMLTSDHAPWPLEKKQAPNLFDNASGAPGVETLFPLLYSEGVAKRDLAPIKLARMLCENPARRFNLFPRKGRIALGADADFALLDRDRQWTLRAADMRSSAGWSPFDGMQIQGKVVRTVLRGKTIFDGTEVTAEAGYGTFIPAIRSPEPTRG